MKSKRNFDYLNKLRGLVVALWRKTFSTGKKIFIPFPDFRGLGGPMTFMANLKNYLDSRNFSYAKYYGGEKVIFFPISYDLEILQKIKNQGGKIIQRLDGAYYPSQHGENFSKLNQPMKTVYQDYADYVVFQSLYSKKQCFFMFGEKPTNQYSIITNGVNKKIFYPNALKQKIGKIKFVTTGAFRKKAMLEPLILALDSLRRNYDFELSVVGPILSSELRVFLNRNYVIYHGSKKANQLAEILRQSDVFLHSQINDNCPNAVLEAISCGLPVVAFDSGAMSELVFFSPELLTPVSDELLQKYEDFKPALLARKIAYLLENYEKYRTLALANCQLYSMTECGKKYIEVFNRFIS